MILYRKKDGLNAAWFNQAVEMGELIPVMERTPKMSTMGDRAIAIDVSCECGAFAKGLYSGDGVDYWQDNHEHSTAYQSPDSSNIVDTLKDDE